MELQLSYKEYAPDLLGEIETFATSTSADKNIINSVSDILLDVKKNGDQALIERTLLYDKANLNKSEIILLVFVLCFPNKKGKKLEIVRLSEK